MVQLSNIHWLCAINERNHPCSLPKIVDIIQTLNDYTRLEQEPMISANGHSF